ncbi:MAG: dihydrodipicolinate synthase family protein [Salinirussus sp.]
MNGTGVPLVTPFTVDGDLDEPALREAATWVVDNGVDFVVPCGSNGESALMTAEERDRATAIVADAVSVPVLAGTGHAGLRATIDQTARAAEVGADGALVVTPYYFTHDQEAFAAYYRELADATELPIYLYSVPAKTGVHLEPETVGDLADHPNIAGMKDSAGDLIRFQRERRAAQDEFSLFVGSGGMYAPALDAGADGGVLALANVVPELCAEIARLHREGEGAAARALNADLVELNRAITAQYGVPAVKAAMRHRGVPAGEPRAPHRRLDEDTREVVIDQLEVALSGDH